MTKTIISCNHCNKQIREINDENVEFLHFEGDAEVQISGKQIDISDFDFCNFQCFRDYIENNNKKNILFEGAKNYDR